jgi:hypothetical protein
MKIIEEHHGRRYICENCQSILEYIKSDINYEDTNFGRQDQYINNMSCLSL